MSTIYDKATVDLFVNGIQAQQAMEALKKKATDLSAAIAQATSAGDKKKAKVLQRELDKTTKELTRVETAAKGTGIVLKNLGDTSIHGLNNALKFLRKELAATKPDTEQWREYAQQIKEVEEQLKTLNKSTEPSSKSLWERVSGLAVQAWPVVDLAKQGFGVMQEYVDAFAGMDQEMANVRKFTGMSAEAVEVLNRSFREIDTRTSREGLNILAQEAGRLGKTSVEDVLGFVKAADQINVALDDLGEGATLTLSKLTGIFGDEARYGTQQSLLKVGSVINELSQNCSASAPFLAEFASRMGGVGAQAKLTIPQVMAFGAVLDANGQQVESSSTAISQVIVRMMQEPAKYAKVAGLDVKKFTAMLKTDVNGALILFLETLNKAGGIDNLSPMFKDMGETGSQAIATLATLATNIEQVKAQQEAAAEAFAEGTSISKEFEVQNTTVAANLEKAKNRFHELQVEIGEKLQPLLTHMVTSAAAMSKALVVLMDYLMKNKAAILTVATSVALYTVAVKANSLWLDRMAVKTLLAEKASKAMAGATGLTRVAIVALTNGFQYFRNGLSVTHSMQERWRKSMQGMSFGSWTGLILALGTALALLWQRFKKVGEEVKVVDNIRKEAAEKVAAERVSIELLVDAAKNERLSLEERQKAIAKLNSIIPGYNAQLDATSGKYKANAAALDDYLKKLTKKYELEGAKEKLAEIGKEKAKVVMELADAQKALDNAKKGPLVTVAGGGNSGALTMGTADIVNFHSRRVASKSRELEDIKKREQRILDVYGTDLQKDAAENTVVDPTPTNPAPAPTPDPSGYTSQVVAEKERKKREAEARREAAKEKQEFKAQLNAYKAARDAAEEELLRLYQTGELTYEELLEKRHANEVKYYDNSMEYFRTTFADQKDTYLADDKDYSALLLNKEKATEKYAQELRELKLEEINLAKSRAERDAEAIYNNNSAPTIQDELTLQATLYAVRKKALDDTAALYAEGSKERADIAVSLEELAAENQLAVNKIYFQRVSDLRAEYDRKSLAERYELEKAVLDALLKAEKISAQEYASYLQGLTAKYKKDLPGKSQSAERANSESEYARDTAELKSALAAQIVTQQEFNERMAALDSERRERMFEGLKQSGGEWNAMLSEIYLSFVGLFDSLGGSTGDVLGKVSACVAATSAAIGAGMQIATEFAKAEADIQTRAVERRYDREVELAQGNSYKVAALEKKKEQELAKIKNEANKKAFAMQVIQAVAQTATNALGAYGSAVQVPMIGYILAPIAAAMAVAQGAMQVALIRKQQQASEAQGYSRGGFTKPGAVDEPAGIVHAGEWVASQKLLANPVARPMIDALDYAQRTNTIGSLRAEDVSRSIRAGDSLARMSEDRGTSAMMVGAVLKNAEALTALNARLNEPFVTVNTVAGDHGINRAMEEHARLINNITPKTRRR